MTTLEQDRDRAQLALQVLENPLYIEAHELIDAGLVEAWRQAKHPDDREQLHKLLGIHQQHKAALEAVIRTGELAAAELARRKSRAEEIADLASRRRA